MESLDTFNLCAILAAQVLGYVLSNLETVNLTMALHPNGLSGFSSMYIHVDLSGMTAVAFEQLQLPNEPRQSQCTT